jgi:dTDP-glucose 4,6-dehydratase
MKTYLVTGGYGFIGSNYINYILNSREDIRIVNLDCLNYCSSLDNITYQESIDDQFKKYIFVEGNITDKDIVSHVLETYNVSVIIHFAAQSHVDNSFNNSLQYTIDNVYGTHVLLNCSYKYGRIERFIHFSTDEVYGEVDINHSGCNETSLLNPTNPYAATKAAAEFIVRSYYYSFKLPVIIVRCNNVYGYNQYPEKLIPRFIKLLQLGKKLTIQGNGSTRRNFIWVDDVAKATEIITENGLINNIYNIGTSTQEYSVLDIASILVHKIKGPQEQIDDFIEYVSDRPFNDFRYHLDCTKLKELGWEPEFNNFSDNIDLLINHSL